MFNIVITAPSAQSLYSQLRRWASEATSQAACQESKFKTREAEDTMYLESKFKNVYAE